jgi:hypothetical protein
LLAPATAQSGSHLDRIGRLILATFDYQAWGGTILVVLVCFCVWRKWRYKSWPAQADCFHVLLSLLGCIGGITIPVVFLMTKPPATDMLAGPHFVLIGLAVPILIFGAALPRLKALFFPSEAPRPVAKKELE